MEGSAIYFLLLKEQNTYGYCIQPFLTTRKVYGCTVSGCEFAALLGPAKPVILKEHTCRTDPIEPVQKASIHFISEQFDRIIVQIFNGTPYSETSRDIPKMMSSSNFNLEAYQAQKEKYLTQLEEYTMFVELTLDELQDQDAEVQKMALIELDQQSLQFVVASADSIIKPRSGFLATCFDIKATPDQLPGIQEEVLRFSNSMLTAVREFYPIEIQLMLTIMRENKHLTDAQLQLLCAHFDSIMNLGEVSYQRFPAYNSFDLDAIRAASATGSSVPSTFIVSYLDDLEARTLHHREDDSVLEEESFSAQDSSDTCSSEDDSD